MKFGNVEPLNLGKGKFRTPRRPRDSRGSFRSVSSVGVAQLVEHWTVDPVVVGSIPIIHPRIHPASASWSGMNSAMADAQRRSSASPPTRSSDSEPENRHLRNALPGDPRYVPREIM